MVGGDMEDRPSIRGRREEEGGEVGRALMAVRGMIMIVVVIIAETFLWPATITIITITTAVGR